MKKLYEKPSIELVVFNYADVMAASGDDIVSTWLIDNEDNPKETISETANWISPESSEPILQTSVLGALSNDGFSISDVGGGDESAAAEASSWTE